MLSKGTTLAGYRIDGVLGQGGMGTVYEATQLSLNRRVALKLLAAHISEDADFRERFRREGQIQARLDHPHIVTVHEAGETEHGLFIAMRLVRGTTLKDMILGQELDAERTLRILAPLAEALDEAHESGLIHRDLKPQNMLVGSRDHAYLADFGLTKDVNEKSLTRTGYFLGTLDYVSPEQIKGEHATAASDLYSFAGVLYECLTGVVPYPRPSEAAVLYAHVSAPPPRLTEHRAELPERLDDVIARAMAKDPAERHASAVGLIESVDDALPHRLRTRLPAPVPILAEPTVVRPTPPATPGVPTRRREATPADAPATKPETVVVPLPTPPPITPEPEPEPAPESAAPGSDSRPPVPEAEPVEETSPTPPPAAEPEPGPEAEPASAQSSRGRRWRPAVAVAGAVAAVLVMGFLVGRSLSGDEPTRRRPGATVSAGALALTAPDRWKRATKPPAIAGLRLANPVVLAPQGGPAGATITAGTARREHPSLLPAGLRTPSGSPKPTAVRLGELQAYRYDGLRAGDRTLRVYTVPTTGGVATIACAAPGGSPRAVAADCDRAALSLRLRWTKPLPLGPDTAYLNRLGAVVSRLNANAARSATGLRRARTAKSQARAASQIENAYAAAAKALKTATSNPHVRRSNAALVRALLRLRATYERLAAAAAGRRSGAYARARRDIAPAAAELRRTLARARLAGA
jgi:serine/threonine protein kinase